MDARFWNNAPRGCAWQKKTEKKKSVQGCIFSKPRTTFTFTHEIDIGLKIVKRERNVMSWATFNYACVYAGICDAQHSAVTVHWGRFQESRKFWTECAVTVCCCFHLHETNQKMTGYPCFLYPWNNKRWHSTLHSMASCHPVTVTNNTEDKGAREKRCIRKNTDTKNTKHFAQYVKLSSGWQSLTTQKTKEQGGEKKMYKEEHRHKEHKAQYVKLSSGWHSLTTQKTKEQGKKDV